MPTSNRGYTTIAELEEFADIDVTNDTEGLDQISMAEELLDSYVGFQHKAVDEEIQGLVASGGSSTFTLQLNQQSTMQLDYLKGCWVEIIGGTGAGQRRKISGQTYAGVVTVESGFSTALDSTSYYRIYQLGKFPRQQDMVFDGTNTPNRYYKSIPEAMRRATASQVEFIIKMGASYFSSDSSDKSAERIGNYSYQKGGSQGKTVADPLIAPKAKIFLRGLVNRVGQIVND